jgi:hypothetical protein
MDQSSGGMCGRQFQNRSVSKIKTQFALLVVFFKMFASLAYASTLMLEAIYSCEKSIDLH